MDNDRKIIKFDKNHLHRGTLATRYVVRVAVMAAMLTSLKFAMSFVPNVEPVTLLILVYASAFGAVYAIPTTLIFCAVEVAIYGMGSWVLLYFLYWPALALVASLLLKKHNIIVAVVIAAIFSVLFGVLSACCDTLFCIVNLAKNELGQYWVAYYLRGIYFDLTHIVSNIIVVIALYKPLYNIFIKLYPQGKIKYVEMGKSDEQMYRKELTNKDNFEE